MESETKFINSDISYAILFDSINITVSGRTVVSEKTNSPYLRVVYFPNLETAETTFSSGIKHWCSKDGNYIIAKYEDNSYKIFNFHEINNLIEFKNNFPSFIDTSTITDFEFVGDYLLIFTTLTNESLYAIPIKNNLTRIDNLSDQTLSYQIDYTKHNLLGSRNLEGVKVNFSMIFGTL